VKLGDLDDFINPSQACVVALSGESQTSLNQSTNAAPYTAGFKFPDKDEKWRGRLRVRESLPGDQHGLRRSTLLCGRVTGGGDCALVAAAPLCAHPLHNASFLSLFPPLGIFLDVCARRRLAVCSVRPGGGRLFAHGAVALAAVLSGASHASLQHHQPNRCPFRFLATWHLMGTLLVARKSAPRLRSGVRDTDTTLTYPPPPPTQRISWTWRVMRSPRRRCAPGPRHLTRKHTERPHASRFPPPPTAASSRGAHRVPTRN
jgi:hypothetical protein